MKWMAMAMSMQMAICEVVAVLLGGFMVEGVTKEECGEQAEPQRRHEAAVLVYVQKRRKRRSIIWSMRKTSSVWTATAPTRT